MPSILRDLKILEVSGVDRGAGDGVRVVLMKRHDGDAEEADMTKSEAIRKAHTTINGEVERLVKTEKITRSQAFDRTIKDFPQEWELYKRASAAAVL